MKNLALLAFLLPLAANAFDNETFKGSVAIDPLVHLELKKFPNLPDDYVNKVPSTIKNHMFDAKATFLRGIGKNPCRASTTVTFMNAGQILGKTNYPRMEQDAVEDFEGRMIKIEAIGCLKAGIAQEAMEESRKSSFQMSVIDALKSSQVQGASTCEKTSIGWGIGDSNYCYKSKVAITPTESYLFTQNTWNSENLVQFKAPVYFRSILISFHEVNNQTYSHSIAYVSGAKVPGIGKGFARSTISSTQSRTFAKLNQLQPR